MALRRLAAAESPFRRLRVATFDSLKVAGKAEGCPLSSAREWPLRRIGVSDSTLSRVVGCDSTLRRVGAAASGSWAKQQLEFGLDSSRRMRLLSTLPGGGGGGKSGSGSGGGGDQSGPAGGGGDQSGSGGGGDKSGSGGGGDKSESGGGGDKFDWDNFNWAKFREYFKIAEIVRTILKMCAYFVVGLSTCGSIVMFLVYFYVRSEVQTHVSVEREKREEFEKKATIAHQEFVFRTNSRYDNLQAQFNELREKNMELQQLVYDSRNLVVALMAQLTDLQNKLDVQAKEAKGHLSEFSPDGS